MFLNQLLLFQLVATAMMTDIIWLIQRVQYPIFLGLDKDRFPDWHELHSARITWIVAPLMILELFLNESHFLIQIFLFISTGLIWLLTFFVSVPIHKKLSENGFDQTLIFSLIRTNWSRTLCYSIKLVLVIYLCHLSFTVA